MGIGYNGGPDEFLNLQRIIPNFATKDLYDIETTNPTIYLSKVVYNSILLF